MNKTQKKQLFNHRENILKPDFCPQINVDISFGSGGLILHNNKLCVSKKLDKNSFLYKSFNVSKNKKQYLVKEHTQNNKNELESIKFFAITSSEFKKKRSLYKKKSKNNKNNK